MFLAAILFFRSCVKFSGGLLWPPFQIASKGPKEQLWLVGQTFTSMVTPNIGFIPTIRRADNKPMYMPRAYSHFVQCLRLKTERSDRRSSKQIYIYDGYYNIYFIFVHEKNLEPASSLDEARYMMIIMTIKTIKNCPSAQGGSERQVPAGDCPILK